MASDIRPAEVAGSHTVAQYTGSEEQNFGKDSPSDRLNSAAGKAYMEVVQGQHMKRDSQDGELHLA